MFTAHSNDRWPSDGLPPGNPLAQRVRHYFDRHPEVSRDEFLLEALTREITSREQREMWNGSAFARRKGRGATMLSTRRPRPSADEIRMHAWLSERLAMLRDERHRLWPKLKRFLFGNARAR